LNVRESIDVGASFPSDAKDSQVIADIPNAVAFGSFGVAQ
jgi:hypothetical protein